MSNKLQENSELLSALLDGELRGEEFEQALDCLARSEDARNTWETYHLAGEAMRSGTADLRSHDPLFVVRLRREIALDNPELIAEDAFPIRAGGQKYQKVASANDPWWQRVAGLAAVLLVVVLAWQGFQFSGQDIPQVAGFQLMPWPAQPAAPGLAVSARARGAANGLIRDPQLDALLAAHRQFGGTSALQMPSGFLRNATFQGSGD